MNKPQGVCLSLSNNQNYKNESLILNNQNNSNENLKLNDNSSLIVQKNKNIDFRVKKSSFSDNK